MPFEPICDWLGTPVFADQADRETQLPVREVPPSPGFPASALGHFLGFVGTIASDPPIAFEFASDGAAMAPELAGNFCFTTVLQSQSVQHISFTSPLSIKGFIRVALTL